MNKLYYICVNGECVGFPRICEPFFDIVLLLRFALACSSVAFTYSYRSEYTADDDVLHVYCDIKTLNNAK